MSQALQLREKLAERVRQVEERIGAACARAGRSRADVTLVAVTKSTTAEIASLLPGLGQLDLGESRPQELWRKAALVPNVRWHMIGHLQRNKIDKTLPLLHFFHSVDSWRLLQALDLECASVERDSLPICLELNMSREAQKHGLAPEDMNELPARLAELKHVQVRGLMTMAAFSEDPEESRAAFRELRELRDRLRAELPPPHVLEHLSMGMTNDFEVAIEEGSTLIRLGSILFEGLGEPEA